MSSTEAQHLEIKDLLAQQRWDEAESLWLELAEQFADQPEFLLLTAKEFADSGQAGRAADLASLLTPGLKTAGKLHEWLYALKLQSHGKPNDKAVRAELLEAYGQIYQSDARLRHILSVVEFDQPRTPLPVAIARADVLLALQAGSFCQHKSWGFGHIKVFDATLGRIVVAFPHNPDHALQLAYAAESLLPVSPEHIDVRKITELENLRQMAAADPVGLVRIVLLSHNRAASADLIERALSGAVISGDQWKRWWENAKKLLNRDPHFDVPAKKTDPVVLRAAPASQQDELLTAFRDAPSLGQRIDVARRLLKKIDDMEDADLLLQEFQDGMLDSLRKLRPDKQSEKLEAALLIEELRAHQRTPAEGSPPLLGELLAGIKNIHTVLEGLSPFAQKRVVAALKTSHPEKLLNSVNMVSVRVLSDMAELLPQAAQRIERFVRNQTASAELLCWVSQNRPLAWLESLPPSTLLIALLNALDSASSKSARKIRDLLLNDQTLLTDLLDNASTDTIRDVARRILASPALEELDRRSLMGRLVKEFSFVQEFLVTRTAKEQPLIVSRASYERRKIELEEIIQKKIPQNSKEIGQARSYGDLRENFEYKAAKDMQKLLMRRRAELEILLARAQPAEFADAKTDAVQLGTTVMVTDVATEQRHAFHILGAWDGDPARNIISYPAALAQTLLNKKAGDVVEVAGETGTLQYRIERVERVSPEVLRSL